MMICTDGVYKSEFLEPTIKNLIKVTIICRKGVHNLVRRGKKYKSIHIPNVKNHPGIN